MADKTYVVDEHGKVWFPKDVAAPKNVQTALEAAEKQQSHGVIAAILKLGKKNDSK